MWEENRLHQWLDESSSNCALLLDCGADGKWVVRQMHDSGSLPCRIAQNEKSALHSMSALFQTTAKPAVQKKTVAFADELWPAAVLAGLLGGAITFEPLDSALGTLALLYSGSLRTSPPV